MIKAYKPVGMTPLELLHRIKVDGAAYAGRLDPMAEGLMIYLDKNEEKKNRKKFENLKKTYEFDVLFGIKTDTYDILGIPRKASPRGKPSIIATGDQIQSYPPFSYIRVKGKPLWWWARNNKLSEVDIPSKKININKLELIKKYKISNSQLLHYIKERIAKVKGDFRQEKVIKAWEKLLESNNNNFDCAKFKVECSSGTYVRGIANEMNGIAISIERIKIGEYSLKDEDVVNLM